MQRSFEEFYNVLFRFLWFAQVAERIKESRSKSGCYFVEEDAGARTECAFSSSAAESRVHIFQFVSPTDVHGASHRDAFLTREDGTKYRDTDNGDGINLASPVIIDVTDWSGHVKRHRVRQGRKCDRRYGLMMIFVRHRNDATRDAFTDAMHIFHPRACTGDVCEY